MTGAERKHAVHDDLIDPPQQDRTPDLWPADPRAPYEGRRGRSCSCGKVDDTRVMWFGENEWHSEGVCYSGPAR